MSVLNELNETIRLLEREIPASPKRNERLEKRLQKSLVEYFHDLEDAIDWDALDMIYYRNVT